MKNNEFTKAQRGVLEGQLNDLHISVGPLTSIVRETAAALCFQVDTLRNDDERLSRYEDRSPVLINPLFAEDEKFLMVTSAIRDGIIEVCNSHKNETMVAFMRAILTKTKKDASEFDINARERDLMFALIVASALRASTHFMDIDEKMNEDALADHIRAMEGFRFWEIRDTIKENENTFMTMQMRNDLIR